MKLLNQPLKNIKWLKENSKTGFKYLAGINRSIYPAQVTKLANSLNKMNCIRPIVTAVISFITGKSERYIIDGQHLFNAMIRNNMSIPYIDIKIKDKQDLVETIALLNASSKSWSMLDYITAWSSLIPDYVRLNHYYQVYDIELSTIAGIMNGGVGSSGSVTKRIKDGKFKIVNESDSVKILDYLTDILKIVPRMNRYENNYLCSEYIKFINSTKNYEKIHLKFLGRLEEKRVKFVLATQEEGKLQQLFNELTKN